MKAIILAVVAVLTLSTTSCGKNDLAEDQALYETEASGGDDGEVIETPEDD